MASPGSATALPGMQPDRECLDKKGTISYYNISLKSVKLAYRKDCELLAQELSNAGISSRFYHAGVRPDMKGT